jgi:hypothetical protein
MTPQETENARKLVAGSQVFAINSREGFASQYPTLNGLSADEWTGLLTIAGAGTALLMIPGRFSPEQQKELTATVVMTIQEWDEHGVQTLADFINFVTADARQPDDIPDAIGGWVLRNVQLVPAEHSAPHVIGLMLMNTFAPWWDQEI